MRFFSLPAELHLEILALAIPANTTLNVVHELTTEAQEGLANTQQRPVYRNDVVTKIGCYSGTGHVRELYTAAYRLSWEPSWVPELTFVSKTFTPLVRSLLSKTVQIRVSEQSVREPATSGVGMLSIFDRRIENKVPWAGQLPNIRLGGLPTWITLRARTLVIEALEPERAARSLSFLELDRFASLREVTVGLGNVVSVSDTSSYTSDFDMLVKLENICSKDGIDIPVYH
jgi:hypothetical protein